MENKKIKSYKKLLKSKHSFLWAASLSKNSNVRNTLKSLLISFFRTFTIIRVEGLDELTKNKNYLINNGSHKKGSLLEQRIRKLKKIHCLLDCNYALYFSYKYFYFLFSSVRVIRKYKLELKPFGVFEVCSYVLNILWIQLCNDYFDNSLSKLKELPEEIGIFSDINDIGYILAKKLSRMRVKIYSFQHGMYTRNFKKFNTDIVPFLICPTEEYFVWSYFYKNKFNEDFPFINKVNLLPSENAKKIKRFIRPKKIIFILNGPDRMDLNEKMIFISKKVKKKFPFFEISYQAHPKLNKNRLNLKFHEVKWNKKKSNPSHHNEIYIGYASGAFQELALLGKIFFLLDDEDTRSFYHNSDIAICTEDHLINNLMQFNFKSCIDQSSCTSKSLFGVSYEM